MDSEKLRRVKIWSGWLRLSHACTGVATPVLLLTGWLLAESPSLAASAMVVHYIAAAFLCFGLVVRLLLVLAGKEHERIASLFPASSELTAMTATLRCYLSLGRSPLPAWYAQNPLWKPFYLVIYIALTLLAITGIAMPEMPLLLGFYLPSVHVFWARLVFWFSLLHIAAVILHDYKSRSTDISAMVNGYRLFIIDSSRSDGGVADAVQVVTLDSPSKRD